MPVRDDNADESAPEDTVTLVGNEVWAAILRTLSDARPLGGPRPVLSFSVLRAQIDVVATPRWELEVAATDTALTVDRHLATDTPSRL
jgi:hypothetical protein